MNLAIPTCPPDDPLEVAHRIRDGYEHRLDLILCDCGYKMKVVPEAVFDDGFLYLRVFDEGWSQILAGLAKARLLESETRKKRCLPIDGSVAREGDFFRFQVLPRALRMWY